jgi:hypothetical protein
MAITGIRTSPPVAKKVTLGITVIPNTAYDAGTRLPAVTSATVVFGSDPSSYGQPQNLSVTQDAASGQVEGTVVLDITGLTGDTVFFLPIVNWSDGTIDNPGDCAFPNAPAPSGPATGLQMIPSDQEIPLSGGSAVITVKAIAGSSAAAGRSATFEWKTGQAHGTLSPSAPQNTDTNGQASVTFVPSQAGEAQIEATVDGLTARCKVKVKK